MSPIDLGSGLERILVFLFGGSTLGLLALLSRHYLTRFKLGIEAAAGQRKTDLDVEVHRDSLTIQLLETARSEVAALRIEVERLRPNEAHIRHFEMALNHLERVLLAENEPERRRAERAARAFVNRMRRLADARGVIANEVQMLESRTSIADQAEDEERLRDR